MKIILTNNVVKKNITEDVHDWINYMFKEKFNGRKLYHFDDLKNKQVYRVKVRYRERKKHSFFLFKRVGNFLKLLDVKINNDFEKRDSLTYEIKEIEKRNGSIEKPKRINVFRVNYNGEYKVCGNIYDNTLYLKRELMNKYDMPPFEKRIEKEDFDKFIYFDEEENKYILNFFERKIFDYDIKSDEELLDIFENKFEYSLRCYLFRKIRDKEERKVKVDEFIGLTNEEKVSNIRDGRFNQQFLKIKDV